LLGFTVVAFTYDDVIGRPEWVIDQVRLLLARAA